MKLAMVMSQKRLAEEYGMLNRLAVGLLNDHANIIRVIPKNKNEAFDEHENAVSIAQRFEVEMPTAWMNRRNRKNIFAEQLDELGINVIAAFGKDALQLALDVKRKIDCVVMSEITSMPEASSVRKREIIDKWFSPSASMERVVASKVGQHRSALVPFGVSKIKQIPKSNNEQKCAVILAADMQLANTTNLLKALKQFKDLHIFIELLGKKQHKIWRVLKTLDMLNQVTCLRNMAQVRPLIIEADLALIPAANMPMRSILLETMGSGTPIVSVKVDGLDMLIEEETALIVNHNWSKPLTRILEEPKCAQHIGNNGHKLVISKYGSDLQIKAFKEAASLF